MRALLTALWIQRRLLATVKTNLFIPIVFSDQLADEDTLWQKSIITYSTDYLRLWDKSPRAHTIGAISDTSTIVVTSQSKRPAYCLDDAWR